MSLEYWPTRREPCGISRHFARCSVEYVLADLGDDLARQVGIDAGNEDGRDDEAGAQLVRRAGRFRAGVETPAVALALYVELAVVLAARRRFSWRHGPGCGVSQACRLQLLQPGQIGGGRVVAALRIGLLLQRRHLRQGVFAAERDAARRGACTARGDGLHRGARADRFVELAQLVHAAAFAFFHAALLFQRQRAAGRPRRSFEFIGAPHDDGAGRGDLWHWRGRCLCWRDETVLFAARDLAGEHAGAACLGFQLVRRAVLLRRAVPGYKGHHQQEDAHGAANQVDGQVVDPAHAGFPADAAGRSVRRHVFIAAHGAASLRIHALAGRAAPPCSR